MTDKPKPKFNPDDVARKVGALFSVLDATLGQVRSRVGIDPTPLRIRIKGSREQQSSEEHQAQGQNNNGNGGLLQNILSRFPRLLNRQPSAEPARDPNQPEESDTIEFWSWQAKNDKEPTYGTKEHDTWDARQLDYRNHMWRLKRGSLVRGSVVMDKPTRGTIAH